MPFGQAVAIKILAHNLRCDKCKPSEREHTQNVGKILMPIFLVMFIPNLCSISMRFVLFSMVDDKRTKMRETLRMMSLSRLSYTMSFYLMQGFFSVFNGLILAGILYGDPTVFPQQEVSCFLKFLAAVVLYSLASIPFAMALSTPFNDPKVASMVGGLLLVFPMFIYLQLVTV